jgi:primosomal protein N' (replication factor Y)
MTYHRVTNRLVCHICGEVRDVPNRCPNPECRDPAFKYVGLGTQKVEDVVKRIFPKARVERIDADVTTKKDAYDRILGNFRVGNIDILIGTQMIAKGLHFPNVTLVGVVQADVALHMPDFRAGERTFQLLTQVAGRAGRGEVPGEVIVQTFTPFHPAIQAARRMDYDGFMDQEIEMRKEFHYPPFAHLVCMTIRGKEEQPVNDSAEKFAARLREGLSTAIRLAGPAPAPLARAKGYYRYQLMMRGKSVKAMDQVVRRALDGFRWPKDVYCAIDVDALNIL